MTGLQIYAWYIAPLVALAACYGLYRWAATDSDKRHAR